jgi:integrase
VISFPCLVRSVSGLGGVRYALGDRFVDRYLEFAAGRCRPDTLRAVAFDLGTFFTVIPKDPVLVTAADVSEFLAGQRGDRSVIRLADREPGLSARTTARRRAGLEHATCDELRHTCLTRLREAGMALEAVQARAGHAWIESTRIYLHLTSDWLAGEYQRAPR